MDMKIDMDEKGFKLFVEVYRIFAHANRIETLQNLVEHLQNKKTDIKLLGKFLEIMDAPIATVKSIDPGYIHIDDVEGVMSQFSDFQKELRKAIDLRGGVTKVSNETGLPQPTLSRMMLSIARPKYSTIRRIADALNIEKIPVRK